LHESSGAFAGLGGNVCQASRSFKERIEAVYARFLPRGLADLPMSR
jgi:hypothetical protein